MDARLISARVSTESVSSPSIQRVTVNNLASVNGKPIIVVDLQSKVPTLSEIKGLVDVVFEKGNGNVILTNAHRADAALEMAGLQNRVQVTDDAGAPVLARQALSRRQRLAAW